MEPDFQFSIGQSVKFKTDPDVFTVAGRYTINDDGALIPCYRLIGEAGEETRTPETNLESAPL